MICRVMKVSKNFMDDFNLVIEYYEFTQEEVQDAKDAVKMDYELSKDGFKAVADHIRIISHCSSVIDPSTGLLINAKD